MAKKGQFKKGGGRVGDGRARKSKKHGSTALVRYVPSAPTVRYKTRTHTVVKHSKGGGRSLMKREHGAGEFIPGPFRQKSMAISAALGYAKGGHGLTQLNDLMEKIPSIGNVPKVAIAALIANKFADRGDWYDAGAQSLCDIAAYEFGQQGLKMSVSGDEDD